MSRRERNVIRIGVILGTLAGMIGCAHGPAPAVETETVGQLSASYHSIAVQPVHESTPPPTFEIAGSADSDDAAPVVTAADAGPDAAPEVVSKGGGLVTGEVR